VRSLYFQQRAPVAFVLVALITIATVMDYAPLQLAAGLALLALILQVLFEIDEKTSAARTITWYPTFQEALPQVTQEIERRLRRGRRASIKWVGVTHEAGWPFSQNVLLNLLNGQLGNSASLQVKLALLDPDGQVCQRQDGPDKEQIRSTKEKISRFMEEHRDGLVRHRSVLAFYMYDHRPTWHALLLDEDMLFYSTCLPGNLQFASPQGGAEVVSVDTDEQSAERIRHFIGWFETIKAEAHASGKSAASQGLVTPSPASTS
jgi:hypothetical protein